MRINEKRYLMVFKICRKGNKNISNIQDIFVFFVFLAYGAIVGTQEIRIMKTRNYEEQSQRRARKVNDIKTMFWTRCAEEERKEHGKGKMAVYEEVAYHFYMSPTEIREIIAGRR